jgi:hypothetical protein
MERSNKSLLLSLPRYGQDRRDGQGLAELLRELGKLEGLRWIRILYAYPSYFTEDLIDEIANNPKVRWWLSPPLLLSLFSRRPAYLGRSHKQLPWLAHGGDWGLGHYWIILQGCKREFTFVPAS